MIVLKRLKWSNCLSYGDNNEIQLSDLNLVKLEGQNGVGKSTIPLLIEEVLYGKNSRGIKKADLVNRYSNKDELNISIDFTIGSDNYTVSLSRKATIKLKLIKNNEDISSHTAPATYKQIENIIGLDFKTFTQLIYQSSTSSLQFLTSTDTQRKKFLISLFSLEKYTKTHDIFKELYKETNKEISKLMGKFDTINDWIVDSKKIDLIKKKLHEQVDSPDNKIKEVALLADKLKNIVETNKKINKNNQYRKDLDELDTSTLATSFGEEKDSSKLIKEKHTLEDSIKRDKITKDKINKLGNKCHTCYQDISEEIKRTYLEKLEDRIKNNSTKATKFSTEISNITKHNKRIKEHNSLVLKFERLSNFIDNTIATNTLDKGDLENKIIELNNDITTIKSEISKIKRLNISVAAHNAKVKVVNDQIEEHIKELGDTESALKTTKELLAKLSILKDSFSTNGLISYKIESLVKTLEDEINKYLTELSYGRFYLSFVLKGDKLNIDIEDNGKVVTVDSLSTGELARVNVSTLLAIRKLMTAISSTRINVLFLDETYGVLDIEGKNKLSELLLIEELDTFLVAHDYNHPLMTTINIIKENDISRIEV